MAEWIPGDTLTAARLNQKNLYIGSVPPGTTYAGIQWYDTTNNLLKERNALNTAWKVIGPVSQGTFASRPAAGNEGRLYHCTDTKDIWYDNGASWDQWCESVSLKDGDYPAAYVGISAAATGRAANLDATISSRATAADLATLNQVPAPDATTNVYMKEVVGNKADAAQTTVGTTRSLMGYIKGLLSRIDVALSSRSSHTAADVWASATRSLTELRSKLPQGALSTTKTVISGTGWIIAAWASFYGQTETTGYRRVSLSIDGGTARTILEIVGTNSVYTYQASGASVTLLVRYTSGFTPSVAISNAPGGDWGVLYIPDP